MELHIQLVDNGVTRIQLVDNGPFHEIAHKVDLVRHGISEVDDS